MERPGTSPQCFPVQNKSQTYANISFIISTRRNSPLFYNLNTHKTFLLLLV